jgi:hypothetical protein
MPIAKLDLPVKPLLNLRRLPTHLLLLLYVVRYRLFCLLLKVAIAETCPCAVRPATHLLIPEKLHSVHMGALPEVVVDVVAPGHEPGGERPEDHTVGSVHEARPRLLV